MENKTDIIHKPNQTITIKKDITVTQRKAYNVILQKAWFDVKYTNKDQRDFLFSISELKERAGIKATDNWHLKKCLEELSDVKVQTLDDKDNWGFFHLISSVRKEGDNLLIELSGRITEALYKNNYYTTLDMLTIKSLTGKHSVTIYELAIRYSKREIPEMTVEELRQLTGTENKKSYNNFGDFEKRVLKPAIEEINEKTDIQLDYTTKTQGRKTTSLKFIIKSKKTQKIEIPAPVPEEDPNLKMYFGMFKDVAGFEIDLTDLKSLIKDYGEGKVLKYITNYSKFSFSKDTNKSYKINSFKKAIRDEWPIPSHERKKTQNMDFDQRQYSDEDFDKCLSNGNHKRED